MCYFRHSPLIMKHERVPPDQCFVGYKYLWCRETGALRGELRSPHFLNNVTQWVPEEPARANGKPDTRTGQGIYAYARKPKKYHGYVIAKVHLWGVVLEFAKSPWSMREPGFMAEWAEIQELTLPAFVASEFGDKLVERWSGHGVKITTASRRVLLKAA